MCAMITHHQHQDDPEEKFHFSDIDFIDTKDEDSIGWQFGGVE